MEDQRNRTCKRCGQPTNLFYQAKQLGDGTRVVRLAGSNTGKGLACKSCIRERVAALDAKDREKIRAKPNKLY